MATFELTVYEITSQKKIYIVEAETEETAFQKAEKGETEDEVELSVQEVVDRHVSGQIIER